MITSSRKISIARWFISEVVTNFTMILVNIIWWKMLLLLAIQYFIIWNSKIVWVSWFIIIVNVRIDILVINFIIFLSPWASNIYILVFDIENPNELSWTIIYVFIICLMIWPYNISIRAIKIMFIVILVKIIVIFSLRYNNL